MKKKQKRRNAQKSLPGFVNLGERPGPGVSREVWLSYMVQREKIIAKNRAPATCQEATYAVRSASSALRLENCGSVWLERKDSEQKTWTPLRCRSRWCPSCANIWRLPVIEAFTAAITDSQRVTLVTFTGGPSVWPQDLEGRVQGMSRALRRWKRKTAKEGVEGGVYAWEITQNGKKLHAHLHISLVYSADAPWALEDRAALKNGAVNGDLTPALVWLALAWASALEKEAPGLYADLPAWRDLLPSIEKKRVRIFGEVEARRGAVCDIGGRWPNPKKRGEPLSPLGAGDSKKNLEQTVKYAVKNGSEISSAGWMEILSVFRHRRRIQGFGCLFGIKPPVDDSEEKSLSSELTGRAVVLGRDRINDVSDIVKAFVFGSDVSHIETQKSPLFQWFGCRIGGGSQ